MNPVIIYRLCRLCAELKPGNKQLDLQTDSEKRSEIIQKLIRINAPTEFDSTFPSTVCLDCVCSINRSYDFLVKIESAQIFLNDFLQNDKKEYHDEVAQHKEGYYSDVEVPSITDNSTAEIYSECVESKVVHVKTESLSHNDGIHVPEKVNTQKNEENESIEPIAMSKVKQAWESYSWRCTFCDTMFPNIDELQAHGMAAHSCCNPYRCSDCEVRKAGLDKFIAHVVTHHKHFNRSCYKCFKKFSTVTKTKRHSESHFESNFTCLGCNSSFMTEVQQKIHKETYFKIREVRLTEGLTCLKCVKTFLTLALLRSHIRHTHINEYVCQTCGKAFSSRSRLLEHALTHTDDRQHKCQICKLGFRTENGLKGHITRHYDDRPFCCDKCGSSFRQKCHLKRHSIIHTDARPFQCSYCEKRFQRKEYLNVHERLHTGETPYSCETCQHNFSNWPNYNKHMKQRHNIDKSKKKAVLVKIPTMTV